MPECARLPRRLSTPYMQSAHHQIGEQESAAGSQSHPCSGHLNSRCPQNSAVALTKVATLAPPTGRVAQKPIDWCNTAIQLIHRHE